MTAPDGAGPGMRNYVGLFRERFIKELFYDDDLTDGIDRTEKFEKYIPCGIAHPGLCPHKTADIFEPGLQIMRNFERLVMQRGAVGQYYRCVGQPQDDLVAYCCIAYIRRSLGEVVILVEASLVGPDLVWTLDPLGSAMQWPLMCSELAARFLSRPGGPLTSFVVAPCTVARYRHTPEKVRLVGVGDDEQMLGAGVNIAKHLSRKEKVDKDPIEKAFHALGKGLGKASMGQLFRRRQRFR